MEVFLRRQKCIVVKNKISGQFTKQEIMEKYGTKNVSQIKTWMKWFRENEVHRFNQPIGKQYSFGHGPEFLTYAQDEKSYTKLKNTPIKGNRFLFTTKLLDGSKS